MKKVVLYLSDMEKGGAQRVIANLANFLVKNYKVSIITTYQGIVSYDLDNKIQLISLNYQKSPKAKLDKYLNYFKYLQKLRGTINELNPDIIITFLRFEINCILTIKPFIKSRVAISFRNDPKMTYKSKYQINKINTLSKNADGIIFQTNDAKSFFSRKLHTKSTIIKNPINEEFKTQEFQGDRKTKIVAVGKLTEQKNHKLLINAFSKIAHKFPDYELIIYGEGVLRKELEKQICKLNLEERVFLPGVKDNIKDYIHDASLFVLSSNYEGVSNALLEALSLGLPVISTDCPCGGSREIIEDGVNGKLVPVNNIEILAKNMEKLLLDNSLSNNLGKNARLIQEQLNPTKINKQWEDYILSITRG